MGFGFQVKWCLYGSPSGSSTWFICNSKCSIGHATFTLTLVRITIGLKGSFCYLQNSRSYLIIRGKISLKLKFATTRAAPSVNPSGSKSQTWTCMKCCLAAHIAIPYYYTPRTELAFPIKLLRSRQRQGTANKNLECPNISKQGVNIWQRGPI